MPIHSPISLDLLRRADRAATLHRNQLRYNIIRSLKKDSEFLVKDIQCRTPIVYVVTGQQQRKCCLPVKNIWVFRLSSAPLPRQLLHILHDQGVRPQQWNSIEGHESNSELQGMAGLVGVNIDVVGGKLASNAPLCAICCWDRRSSREGHT
jgi:hypothetical protein